MESYSSARIIKYSAFSRFKENVGNNNQMLITACIGIDKIDKTDIGKTEPARWEPQNWENSVNRSRMFLIKAALTWTIDCLDVLLKDFFPYFFKEQNEFQIDRDDKSYAVIYRSIYYKYRVIEDLFMNEKSVISTYRKQEDSRSGKKGSAPYFPDLELIFALIDLAIQWRNHLVHGGIDNPLRQNTKRILSKYETVLNSNEYGTLEIDKMLERYEDRRTPSFKEVTVLIRNIIDFGFIINAYWINCVNKSEYINECLSTLLPSNIEEVNEFKSKEGSIKNSDKIKFFYKIQTLTPDRMKSSICMRLSNMGVVLQKTKKNHSSEEDKLIQNYLLRLNLINNEFDE